MLLELLRVVVWFSSGLTIGFYLGYRYRFLDRFIDIFNHKK